MHMPFMLGVHHLAHGTNLVTQTCFDYPWLQKLHHSSNLFTIIIHKTLNNLWKMTKLATFL
jgi:hypothetical protein